VGHCSFEDPQKKYIYLAMEKMTACTYSCATHWKCYYIRRRADGQPANSTARTASHGFESNIYVTETYRGQRVAKLSKKAWGLVTKGRSRRPWPKIRKVGVAVVRALQISFRQEKKKQKTRIAFCNCRADGRFFLAFAQD